MGKKAGNFAPDANANRFRKEAGKREKYEHKKIGTQAAGRMADSQDTEGGLDVLKKAVIGFALFAAAAGVPYVWTAWGPAYVAGAFCANQVKQALDRAPQQKAA